VVRIVPKEVQPTRAMFRALERVTAAAFGQRRKMLRSSLRSLGNAEALLAACGIDPTRRAETLTVTEFARLASETV
jgi:16S rRNA (adenine1518-N6/adenine1519-N6)-dimethyltransferase